MAVPWLIFKLSHICRHRWDTNSDCRVRRRAHWPLYHHDDPCKVLLLFQIPDDGIRDPATLVPSRHPRFCLEIRFGSGLYRKYFKKVFENKTFRIFKVKPENGPLDWLKSLFQFLFLSFLFVKLKIWFLCSWLLKKRRIYNSVISKSIKLDDWSFVSIFIRGWLRSNLKNTIW